MDGGGRDDGFTGTATWLKGQWSNPSDIFTILLIIGGDIIQVAVAQLCAGPIPYFTPVSFSLGWVAYAVSSMYHAIGENRLMPKPELDCKLINADNGYSRTNCSWILARMLRDFDYWRPPICDQEKREELERLRGQFKVKRAELEGEKHNANDRADAQATQNMLDALPTSDEIRIALRVTSWKNCSPTGTQLKGCGDWVYWIGVIVTVIQLGLASVPWAIHREWYTFLATTAGTALAYASASLPQWTDEKVNVRLLKKPKRVCLTVGNGANEAILILNDAGHLDLEALASPQRELSAPLLNKTLSVCLAILWVAFLINVAGWQQHTWYLVGVGMIGILHNVVVAGMKRQPKAWGFDLEYQYTFVGGKVMQVLAKVEEVYPGAGASLRDELFPGNLRAREKLFWAYADRRRKAHKKALERGILDTPWEMPPLDRPEGRTDDEDIPDDKPYTKVGVTVVVTPQPK